MSSSSETKNSSDEIYNNNSSSDEINNNSTSNNNNNNNPSNPRPPTITHTTSRSATNEPTNVLRSIYTLTSPYSPLRSELSHLLKTTPLRTTPSGDGLENVYVFATTQQAFAFAERVAALGRSLRHTAEMGGCGPVVYVRWTTRRAQGGGADVAAADVAAARACVAEAAGLGAEVYCGAAGRKKGRKPKTWVKEEGEEGEERMRPEWKVMEKLEPHAVYSQGLMRTSLWADEMEHLWWWVKDKVGRADVKEIKMAEGTEGQEAQVGKAEEMEASPAWSMLYGMACVSRTKWLFLPKKNTFEVFQDHQKHGTPEDAATEQKITKSYLPGKMDTLKGLLKEVVGTFRAV
ncbi:hypothetical protein SLS55_000083 [Diplodia seriata]|uniref:4a-hydroxytetrahydrobiopterin dehydratase n=1 Tax=Diplodia seriata TaxID=420778 RepID=A0ABR3CTA8_9PEZI